MATGKKQLINSNDSAIFRFKMQWGNDYDNEQQIILIPQNA
jgi:hypothetical protein